MKKTVKKLELSKETLRRLEGGKLVEAAGGTGTETCGSCGNRICYEDWSQVTNCC